MKKLVSLAALVSVALTGCVSNEEIIPEQKNKEISFEVASYVPQSRASGAFSTDQSFGVNAWYTLDDATDLMMDGVTVSYNENDNDGDDNDYDDTWKTSTDYYWPKKGTIDFIAYYPTGVEPDITYQYNGTDQLTYTNYTVKNSNSTADPDPVYTASTTPSDDLMYASKAIRFNNNADAATNDTKLDYTTGDYGFRGVPTLFNHALAQLKFKVQNAKPNDLTYKWIITVKKIEVTCYDKGSITLTNNGTVNASSVGTWIKPTNEVWTPTGNLITTPLTWNPTTDVTLSTDAITEFDNKTVYILPQTLEADNQKVKVYYNVKVTKQDDTEVDNDDYEEEFDLYTDALKHWQMNKIITYTLSFNPVGEMILFAPAVEDWGTASGTIVVM